MRWTRLNTLSACTKGLLGTLVSGVAVNAATRVVLKNERTRAKKPWIAAIEPSNSTMLPSTVQRNRPKRMPSSKGAIVFAGDANANSTGNDAGAEEAAHPTFGSQRATR